MIYGNMKEHKYEVEGIKPQIMTEVATLLHICCEKGLFTKDDVYKMAEMACMSNEEVHDIATDSIGDVLDKIFTDAKSGKQEAIDALNILTNIGLKDMRDKK